MNIVYGGSFNPPTIAHGKMVQILKEKFNPENIIIVPTATNYTWKSMDNFNDRIKMCKLAFPSCVISDIESRTEKYSGTINTLNELSKTYKDLYFCMGGDNLISIKKWINYESLLSNYKFIVFSRIGTNVNEFIKNELTEYQDKFIVIDFDLDISSTMFRKEKLENIVDENVLEYIRVNKLYEEEKHV